MGDSRWSAVLAALRLPRTVRMRLAVLCASVILLSGGALLAITFLVGGQRSGNVSVRSVINSRPQIGIAVPFPDVPSGANVIIRSGSTEAAGRVTSKGGLTISDVRYAVQFGSSTARHELLIWSILGLLIVTTLGLLLGWRFAGRILRPLRTMREATQRISEKNLHERLALRGPRGDELKELGDTIDGLLGRLEAAFEAQRRFVQNASHELRTPITMMRTSLDVATGKPNGAPDEVHILADKVGEGLDQAERLLEGFLALARAQSSTASDRAEVALADIAAAALEASDGEIAVLGLTVLRELNGVTAIGSANLLPQVVTNLIDNAVRHNESGGWIRVVTESEGDVGRLIVENGGARIEQARVDELGRPFHRLVDRTASDRGAGLGLSIVTAIVEAEGGSVTLTARDEGGLRVVVELRGVRQPGTSGAT